MALKIYLPPKLDGASLTYGPQPSLKPQPPTLIASTLFAKIYVLPGMPEDEVRIQVGFKTITCKVKE